MMLCDVDRLSSTDCSTALREFDQWSWKNRAEGEILGAFCRLTLPGHLPSSASMRGLVGIERAEIQQEKVRFSAK